MLRAFPRFKSKNFAIEVLAVCVINPCPDNLRKYIAKNNYTDFNCGHMATYYALKKLRADQINIEVEIIRVIMLSVSLTYI